MSHWFDPQTPREAGFWLFGLILGLVTGWMWKPAAADPSKAGSDEP